MASACAGLFVFGIVMAILGAILPNLFGSIELLGVLEGLEDVAEDLERTMERALKEAAR